MLISYFFFVLNFPPRLITQTPGLENLPLPLPTLPSLYTCIIKAILSLSCIINSTQVDQVDFFKNCDFEKIVYMNFLTYISFQKIVEMTSNFVQTFLRPL